MIKIGLTGGIGCGKSAATACFSRLDVPIIDADLSARAVVDKKSKGLQAIENRFGAQVLNSDGTLNRQQLRAIIFSDESARQDLEAILHPLIRKHMWDQIDQLTAPYVILDIPLLFETQQHKLVDRVLVIDCPEEIQIQRICLRDNITEPEAQAIIDAQIPRATKLSGADDIINNDGTLDKLEEQVAHLHAQYLQLSESKRGSDL